MENYQTGDTTEHNPMPSDVVAELQRQGGIVAAAEEAAEARGEQPLPPLSGMPGFEGWKRRVLRAAGETYTIIRGQRVPLDG